MKKLLLGNIIALLACFGQHPARAEGAASSGSASFKNCHVKWDEREIIIGNSHIERRWRIDNGLLTATSFRNLDAGIEWIAKPADRPAPYPNGVIPEAKRTLTGTTKSGRLGPVEEESLLLELSTAGDTAFSYQFKIFPDAAGVQMRFESNVAKPVETTQEKSASSTGIETNPTGKNAKATGDSLEDLMLAPQHIRFTQATLLDQTDDHNELVFKKEWLLITNELPLKLKGNVFYAEDILTGSGLLFLKQAALPHARPEPCEWDALMQASGRRLRFAGQGYPFILLAYSGGRAGRIEALQTYQRQCRAYDPKRDAMFLSNTWGDRSRDARINEEFMLKEIEAGARLGVHVVQIDDGWQKGRTANSASGKGAWNGYWDVDPDFWQPDPVRLPRGLSPLVDAAKAKGMKFGVWFGPDSSNHAANWKRDADRLIELHQKDGIDYFKLDSVKATTIGTERNLRKFWDRVLEKSDGKIVFDLDVTAEIRPGYFGGMDVGPIFVENRYTDIHRYWPHQTLRNLWKLSEYVDPLRLRMEFLNNTRKTEMYPGDPLAPTCYQPDYLFATVMYSNPLGWFETSNLPEEYISSVSKLAQVWKRERPALFAGTIIPIGSAPDGVSWTGFASVAKTRTSALVLIFRELNDQTESTFDLPLLTGDKHRITVLAGEGSAEIVGNRLTASIPSPLRYLWLKVEAAD